MLLKKFLKLSIFLFLFTSVFSGINFFIGNNLSYFSGNFSKFSSIVFNLSDLFLFLSIFLFLIFLFQKKFLNNKKNFFNIGKNFFNNFLENFQDKKFNFLFSGLILSSFLTSLFLENFQNFILHISILIKSFSVGFLFFYLPENIFSKKEILNTLIFSFVIQSFIAFFQVVLQGSVGLSFLGENNFGENLNGVAKIGNFFRGYGTLSHPNILGLSSLILYFLAGNFGKSGYGFLKNFLIIGIFFSFSKTAIIGFFALKIYEKIFLIKNSDKNSKNILLKFLDFTFLNKIFKNLKNYKFKIFYLFFYLSIFLSIFYFFSDKILARFQNFFGIGFHERILQFEISKNIFIENILNHNFGELFFGTGFGSFTLEMQNYTDKILKPWEFQPVHNFFILVGTEIGILGLGFLLVLILHIFFTSKKKLSEKNFLILILFFGSFFDHFLLTSSIGIILFWLILKKIKN